MKPKKVVQSAVDRLRARVAELEAKAKDLKEKEAARLERLLLKLSKWEDEALRRYDQIFGPKQKEK